jgi:hypothetical protein
MPGLTNDLNLPRWRKLYHGAIPWVEGFGPEHYDLGNVAPHRPLPRAYARPARRFGAFDFVQVADPSVSALALVAGDRRVIERFIALADDFCARLEPGAVRAGAGPSGSRATGRMLAASSWSRTTAGSCRSCTSTRACSTSPPSRRLPGSRASIRRARPRRGEGEARLDRQAGRGPVRARATAWPCSEGRPCLQVDGVTAGSSPQCEAPRIAVLRLLERMIVGNRPPSAERLGRGAAAGGDRGDGRAARVGPRPLPRQLQARQDRHPSEGPWRAPFAST